MSKVSHTSIKHSVAEKALVAAGFILVKGGGKGAHKKFKKPGCKPVILSCHGKHIDPKAARELMDLGIL